MQGKSHLLVGLTAGVVLDGFVHLSGPALTSGNAVPLSLIISKAVYYFAVGFGALLPDIDNARSTMGQHLGKISKQIQHLAGHRTLFHSLLGLVLGSAIALGLEQIVIMLLSLRGWSSPAHLVSSWHLFFFGTLFGCIMHIAADALTYGGVPLLWPNKVRFGFPPDRHWRFHTGSWIESVVVWSFMILVALGIWQGIVIV